MSGIYLFIYLACFKLHYKIWLQENSFQKKLKKKKLKVKIKAISVKNGNKNKEVDKEQKEEVAEGNEAEQDGNTQKEKASSALLTQKSGRLKPKAKVETLDHPESQESKTSKGILLNITA